MTTDNATTLDDIFMQNVSMDVMEDMMMKIKEGTIYAFNNDDNSKLSENIIFDVIISAMRKNGAQQDELDFIESLKTDTDVINIINKINKIYQKDSFPVDVIPQAITSDERFKASVVPVVNRISDYSDALTGTGSNVLSFFTIKPEDIFKLSDSWVGGALYYTERNINYYLNAGDSVHDIFEMTELQSNPPSLWSILSRPRNSTDSAESEPFSLSGFDEPPLTREQILEYSYISPKIRMRADTLNKLGDKLKNIGIAIGGLGGAKSLIDGSINFSVGIRTGDDLKIAYGLEGMTLGIILLTNSLTEILAKKISSKLLVRMNKFLPVIGGFISASINGTSMVKNIRESKKQDALGNRSRGSAFRFMASMDIMCMLADTLCSLTVMLPGGQIFALAFGMISLTLSFISDLVGFFIEKFDSRTPEQKFEQEFDEYLNSDQFNAFIEGLCKRYRELKYDVLIFRADANTMGSHDTAIEIQKKYQKEISRSLNGYRIDLMNDLWRRVVIDGTNNEAPIHGALNDDLIIANARNLRSGIKDIYTYSGDDIVIAGNSVRSIDLGAGDDIAILDNITNKNFRVNGGPGNDLISPYFLNGYRYANYEKDAMKPHEWQGSAFGGDGDDTFVFSPDGNIDGGAGDNTVIFPPVPYISSGSNHSSNQLWLYSNEREIQYDQLAILSDTNVPRKARGTLNNISNVAIQDARTYDNIGVTLTGNNPHSVVVRWGTQAMPNNRKDGINTLTVISPNCDSVINLINVPKMEKLSVVINGTRSLINKSIRIIPLGFYSAVRTNSWDYPRVPMANYMWESITDLTRQKSKNTGYSTVLNIFREDLISKKTFIFKDINQGGDFDEQTQDVHMSGVHNIVLACANTGVPLSDRELTHYDFSGKSEEVPIITIYDPCASVTGNDKSNIFDYRLDLKTIPESFLSTKLDEYKLGRFNGGTGGINTLDISSLTGDISLLISKTNGYMIWNDKYISSFENISAVKMPARGSSDCVGYFDCFPTVICEGGEHHINMMGNRNEFISLSGKHDCTASDPSTILVRPVPPVVKDTLTISVTFGPQFSYESTFTSDEMYYQFTDIRVNGREAKHDNLPLKWLTEEGDVKIDTVQGYFLQTDPSGEKGETEFYSGITDIRTLLDATFLRETYRKFHPLTATFFVDYTRIGINQVELTLDALGNTLIIPGIDSLNQLVFSEQSGKLEISTKNNPSPFITDTQWWGVDTANESAVDILEQRFSHVFLPDAPEGEHRCTGKILGELIKSRLGDKSRIYNQNVVSYSRFRPYALWAKKNIVSLDHIYPDTVELKYNASTFSVDCYIDINKSLNVGDTTNNTLMIKDDVSFEPKLMMHYEYKYNPDGAECLAVDISDRMALTLNGSAMSGKKTKCLILMNIGFTDCVISKGKVGEDYTFTLTKDLIPVVYFKGRLPHIIYFSRDQHFIESQNGVDYQVKTGD